MSIVVQRAVGCGQASAGHQLIPAEPSCDPCSHRGALVVAAGGGRRRVGGKGDGERVHGAVSRQVLRCLHRALCGLCAAMPLSLIHI